MGSKLRRRLEGSRLAREFYAGGHTAVARALLGKILWHFTPEGLIAVRIVETEAYGGADDPGSHGYRGKTRRNATMFGPPGHAYVYFTYGMHYCLNVVTGADEECSAVLIRAGEPVEGIEIMKARRRTEDVSNLASGPAKLTEALGVDGSFDGLDLCSSPLGISDDGFDVGAVSTSPRIGLSRDAGKRWRYCLEGSRFVSKPWPWAASAERISRSRARRRG